MADHALQILAPQPGIQRDGTSFDSANYIDGQWCRFYNGKPKKIGGYKLIDTGTTDIIREITVVDQQNSVDIYYGRRNSLIFTTYNLEGVGGSPVDRTPVDFVDSENNVWDFDIYSSVDTDVVPPIQPTQARYIIAHAAQNGSDINNNIASKIYYGPVNPSDPDTYLPLIPLNADVEVDGGIAVIGDYIFAYGSNGVVRWCSPNDITEWLPTSAAAIASTKIIQGFSTRDTVTAGLFWSLDSLERGTLDSNGEFTFTTVQQDISIMSSRCIVKYDQLFFWIGTDKFYQYNGLVSTLPNSMSTNYFFDNININAREKVWGIVIPRWNEVWWFYPKGDATECTDVIIYNFKEEVWYDSVLARSAGNAATTLPYPIMADSNSMEETTVAPPPGQRPFQVYGLWMHEYGYDRIMPHDTFAIPSYFETNIMTFFDQDPSNDRDLRVRRIEPDFVLRESPMSVIVRKRKYAQSPVIESDPYNFDHTTEKIDMNDLGGLVSFKFISNTLGGYYEMGKVLLNYAPGDVRRGS